MLKRLFFLSLSVLLLASCGVDKKHFKVEGHLLNINQGEFYIYSENGAFQGIDTIKVEGGRFAFEMPCREPSTLVLVFPNFSETPIFAEPGKKVEISGDASHLKEMKIKGTKGNELMSSFREQIANAAPPQVRKYAATFVEDHPESPVGIYLVKKYIISNVNPDYKEALRLVKLMSAKQPNNGTPQLLERILKSVNTCTVGSRLPQATFYDDHDRMVSTSDLMTGKAVICTWASWSFDSMDMIRRLKTLRNNAKGGLKVVSVNIDASRRECRQAMMRDTIPWHNICDERMFEGKAVKQLALYSVPCIILVENGRITARDISINELENKLKQ
ncbi:MAG: DUF4369 domain-containing protein [Prevotella sp.]|jgi:hypothetical protein